MDIILIALKEEAPNMSKWDNVFFTGVGKVNAAIKASALIEKYKPIHSMELWYSRWHNS